jgi:peptidoglycan/LPS O-acetylase OafA/YrhL
VALKIALIFDRLQRMGTGAIASLPERRGRSAAAQDQILPLTSIRGVAALWVVFGHLLGPILRVLDNSQPIPWLINLARGDQFAVDIFFILSGYIMIVVYGTHVDPVKFYLNRFARIFPLHIVVLGAAIAGFYLLQYNPIHSDAYSLANLVFYFTLTSAWVGLPPAWNPPAWSLSVETFAYLFFPFIQVVAKRLNLSAALVCVFVMGAAHGATLSVLGFADTGTGALLRGVLGFCAGALLRAALAEKQLRFAPAIGLTMIAICAVLNLYEFAVFAIFILIAGLGGNKSGLVIRTLSSRLMVWLGQISYSIYLIHFPLFIGTDRFLHKVNLLQSRAGQATFCLCYVAAVLMISHLSWRFIETPARVAIHRWYGGARPKKQPPR